MAFLSIASFRAVWMAVLSSSVQVLIVKVGALHLIETSVDAGLFEMVVVQVVIVVVMVEQDCCCLLPRSRAWFESKIASSSFSPLHFSSIFFSLSTSGSWKQEQASSPLVAIKMHLFTVVLNAIAFFLHSSRVVVLMLSGGLQAFLITISQPSRISV